MRLIDDDDVPTGFECLCRPIFVLSKPCQAAKNELPVQKRIRTGVSRLDIFASLLIENVKPEIETPEQFNEPLMHQRFGNKNEGALHTAGEYQSMQDEAGFDCLSQAHFIGEQHTWSKPRSNFRCDIKLMRNQVNAPADKSPDFRFPDTMLQLECGNPQIERCRRIKLAKGEPFFRLTEADRIAEFAFTDLPGPMAIEDKPAALGNGLDNESLLMAVPDSVARTEPDSPEGSVRPRVLPLFTGSLESRGHPPAGDFYNRSETKFGFTIADPPLAGMKVICHNGQETDREFSSSAGEGPSQARRHSWFYPFLCILAGG